MADGAYRDREQLYVLQGSQLPAYCVRCGEPSGTEQLKKTYYWHSPVLYVLILFGVLPYAIAATIVRKKISLMVPLCNTHHSQFKNGRMVGMLMFLGAIPAATLLGTQTPLTFGWAFLIGISILIAGGVIFDRGGNFLRPKYIDEKIAIFSGASTQFLSRLEPRPQGIGKP